MFRFPIYAAFFVSFSLNAILSTPPATAETWTDLTGKFSVDAKFTGVEGKNIVLVKQDGSRVSVPIAKLSPESRAQAKSLYQQMMAGKGDTPQNDAANKPSTSASSRSLGFAPPQVPATAPMQEFPDNLSVKETIDFVEKQVKAGHPEVFWYMMPQEMRDTFNNPRLRNAVNPFVDQQSQTKDQFEPLVFKFVEVLVTKKQFVLGSEWMQQIPTEFATAVNQGYDPVVGIVYELADLGFSVDLQERSIKEIIDTHGPRIGAHLSVLLTTLPAEKVDSIFHDLTVEMVDETHAVVRPATAEEDVSGMSQQTEMVLVSGRWVFKSVFDAWKELEEKLESGSFEKEMQEKQTLASEQAQQTQMMAGMMTATAKGLLDSLLAAETQTEFDDALRPLAAMIPPSISFSQNAEESDTPMNFDMADGQQDTVEMTMDSEPSYDIPDGPAPEGWSMDLSNVEIPQTPASGVFAGELITIAEARFENRILHLQDQKDQFDANALIVFLFLDEGESVAGKSFDITPATGFGSPHVHQRFNTGNNSKTEMFMDEYAMRLEFGQTSNGTLPGKIYVCLPNKSMLRGTFEATIEQ